MSSAVINAYVFLFCFAFTYLLAAKRPVLTFSTRIVLVILVGLAVCFAADRTRWHEILGAATLAANGTFITFAAIDYLRWMQRSDAR